ncbi:MAG: RNA polymerase subunit sigma-70 [Blautia sp.]
MEIKVFQQKLQDIQKLALNNGKHINKKVVEDFFKGDGLSDTQIQKVYDYLTVQGIHIEGHIVSFPVPETEEEEENETSSKKTQVYSREEQEYLEEYLDTLKQIAKETEGERMILLEQARRGETQSKKRLAELYMKEVLEIAKDLYTGEVFIGDMIAEGNMGLMMALENLEEAQDAGAFLLGEIRNAILFMLEEQSGQKQSDDILVEKVRNLEQKIKELLEDDEDKYSAEELSAFLDMDVEEIRGILRLTGDDQ